jgi:hypothetical protein
MSIKFVQINALGSKLALPRGSLISLFVYSKNLKYLLLVKPQELELKYLA